MQYTFFTFPAEVRNKIYRNLFASEHGGSRVTPDFEMSRRENGLNAGVIDLHDCLPFLRTCQQVHEEATSIFYGDNVFTFDNEPHGQKKTESDTPDGTRFWCDFVTIFRFISDIGGRNRAKIQHLRLVFLSLSNTLISHEPEHCDGICDALELLSRNHTLRTIDISCSHPIMAVNALCFSFLFRSHPYKFTATLKLFRNIREMIFTEYDPIGEYDALSFREKFQRALSNFKALKAHMESKGPTTPGVERPRTSYGFRGEPINQSENREQEKEN